MKSKLWKEFEEIDRVFDKGKKMNILIDPNYWSEVLLKYQPLNKIGEKMMDGDLGEFLSAEFEYHPENDNDILRMYIGHLIGRNREKYSDVKEEKYVCERCNIYLEGGGICHDCFDAHAQELLSKKYKFKHGDILDGRHLTTEGWKNIVPGDVKKGFIERIGIDDLKSGIPGDQAVSISDLIEKKVDDTKFDYRDPCGANNCECYDNSIKIDAIIEYLDELNKY